MQNSISTKFTFAAVAAIVAALLLGAAPVMAATIYDSIPASVPLSSPSVGFQATQAAELGDYVEFAGTDRTLTGVEVLMNSWACQTGNWFDSTCANPDGSSTGYDHPITLTIYNVDADGVVGSVIAQVTQDVHVPWRPASDVACVGGGHTPPTCSNGYNFVASFAIPSIVVPDKVAYGVSYNTQTYGSSPLGVDGPYNSLNVSVPNVVPSVGVDTDADAILRNTLTAGNYTDGGLGGVGTLRKDTNWTGYVPAARFTAITPDTAAPAVPTHVSPADGAFMTTANQLLIDWNDVTDPSGPVSYFYESSLSSAIEVDGAFSSPAYQSGALAVSEISTAGTPEGIYYWHVRAADAVPNTSAWSTPWSVIVDNTAPTVAITTPAQGATYVLHQVVNAEFSCSDLLSGVASCVGSVAQGSPIDTATLGAKSFTVDATDNSGNVAPTMMHSYTVGTYFGGFLTPITMTSKEFKQTSTIPVKFRLLDANNMPVGGAIAQLYYGKTMPASIPAVSSGGSNTGNFFRYDPVAKQYIFNLSTKGLTTGTTYLRVTLDDGTERTATVTIK